MREATKNEQTEFNDGPARGAFGTRRPARCCCLLLLLPTAQRDDEAVEEARAVAISVSESRKRERKREKDAELRAKKKVALNDVALASLGTSLVIQPRALSPQCAAHERVGSRCSPSSPCSLLRDIASRPPGVGSELREWRKRKEREREREEGDEIPHLFLLLDLDLFFFHNDSPTHRRRPPHPPRPGLRCGGPATQHSEGR